MFKSVRRKLMDKIYGRNPLLSRTIRSGFKAHPFRSIALALYLLPVRSLLTFPRGTTRKRTFTTSAEYYNSLQELLTISKAEDFELVRIGRDYDGGYIMLDDLPGGIAYSFGISGDVSWDKDMASRGYDVFMYDHTIDGLPEENPRFHWSKLGIADGIVQDDRLRTLEELISRNGHEGKRDMILKMDVEGAEWGFFENVKTEILEQFSQITLEFHGMNLPENVTRIPTALRKLNETHELIHLHGQNWGFYVINNGKTYCNQVEATYVRRGKYKVTRDYDVDLPLDIDMQAITYLPDVSLGHWNRKAQFDSSSSTIEMLISY